VTDFGRDHFQNYFFAAKWHQQRIRHLRMTCYEKMDRHLEPHAGQDRVDFVLEQHPASLIECEANGAINSLDRMIRHI